jgi:hypothetical protein
MTKTELFAELLYVGFLSKKGKVYSNLQIIKMKKALLFEIELWLKLCDRIQINNFEEEDKQLITKFISLCDKYPQIKNDHSICYEKK